jgi:hypothetical protein
VRDGVPPSGAIAASAGLRRGALVTSSTLTMREFAGRIEDSLRPRTTEREKAMRIVRFITGAAASAAATLCLAQDFPSGVTVPTTAEIRQRLTGKVFDVKLANGTSWRLEYESNGYFFIDTSTGYKDSGKWRSEDGKLCHEPSKTKASCNDFRVSASSQFLKRNSGEIIQLVAR